MLPSQMLKGILEGWILLVINDSEVYGYEISSRLASHGLDITEGTIYPLLLRLKKEGLIDYVKRPSAVGPLRKYYHLTAKGYTKKEEFAANWQELALITNKLMGATNE